MATPLEDFTFTPHGAPRGQFPWDEWLDGQVWKLTRGEDFRTNPRSFQGTVRAAAKVRGGKARCTCTDDTIVIQFYKP